MIEDDTSEAQGEGDAESFPGGFISLGIATGAAWLILLARIDNLHSDSILFQATLALVAHLAGLVWLSVAIPDVRGSLLRFGRNLGSLYRVAVLVVVVLNFAPYAQCALEQPR